MFQLILQAPKSARTALLSGVKESVDLRSAVLGGILQPSRRAVFDAGRDLERAALTTGSDTFAPRQLFLPASCLTGMLLRLHSSCLTWNGYSTFTSAGIVVFSTLCLTKAVSEPAVSVPVAAKISRFTCSLRHNCTRRCSVRNCAPVG